MEAIWSLEVQVFTSGGFLEALLEPWRSFEELWRSSEALEAISSLEVHKCWIGALVENNRIRGEIAHSKTKDHTSMSTIENNLKTSKK